MAKSSQQVPTICVCFYNLYLSVLINSRSIAYICKHNSAPCIVPLRIRLEDHQWPSSSWPRSSWSHLPGLRLLGFSTPLLPSFNVTGSSCVYVLEVCPSSLSNHSLTQLPMSLQGSREVSRAKTRVLRPTLLRWMLVSQSPVRWPWEVFLKSFFPLFFLVLSLFLSRIGIIIVWTLLWGYQVECVSFRTQPGAQEMLRNVSCLLMLGDGKAHSHKKTMKG